MKKFIEKFELRELFDQYNGLNTSWWFFIAWAIAVILLAGIEIIFAICTWDFSFIMPHVRFLILMLIGLPFIILKLKDE